MRDLGRTCFCLSARSTGAVREGGRLRRDCEDAEGRTKDRAVGSPMVAARWLFVCGQDGGIGMARFAEGGKAGGGASCGAFIPQADDRPYITQGGPTPASPPADLDLAPAAANHDGLTNDMLSGAGGIQRICGVPWEAGGAGPISSVRAAVGVRCVWRCSDRLRDLAFLLACGGEAGHLGVDALGADAKGVIRVLCRSARTWAPRQIEKPAM